MTQRGLFACVCFLAVFPAFGGDGAVPLRRLARASVGDDFLFQVAATGEVPQETWKSQFGFWCEETKEKATVIKWVGADGSITPYTQEWGEFFERKPGIVTITMVVGLDETSLIQLSEHETLQLGTWSRHVTRSHIRPYVYAYLWTVPKIDDLSGRVLGIFRPRDYLRTLVWTTELGAWLGRQ